MISSVVSIAGLPQLLAGLDIGDGNGEENYGGKDQHKIPHVYLLSSRPQGQRTFVLFIRARVA